MVQLLPFPGWSGLHPLITHFPIALFLLLPLLLIITGLSRKKAEPCISGCGTHCHTPGNLVPIFTVLHRRRRDCSKRYLRREYCCASSLACGIYRECVHIGHDVVRDSFVGAKKTEFGRYARLDTLDSRGFHRLLRAGGVLACAYSAPGCDAGAQTVARHQRRMKSNVAAPPID